MPPASKHAEQGGDVDGPVAQHDSRPGMLVAAVAADQHPDLTRTVAQLTPREPLAFVLNRRRGRIQVEHVRDASTERMGHQRIRGGVGAAAPSAFRCGELGLAERVAQPGVDQPLIHRGAVGLVQRLPDGLNRALGRRRRLGRDGPGDLVRAGPELHRRRPPR